MFVYFACWTYFTNTYWPWLPNAGECAGEEFAAIAGSGILSSYLVLFISFYFATYRKKDKAAVLNGPKIMPDEKLIGHVNGNGKASGASKTNGSTKGRKV